MIQTVLVVGGGVMGPEIAAGFANADFPTTLLSRTPSKVRAAPGVQVVEALPPTAPDLVIEAIPEQMDLKMELFARLEAAYGDGPVLATNTSALPLQEMADRLSAPHRFLGIHYFQPAHLLPMVEVTLVAQTSADVLERTREALLRTGRRSAVVRRPLTGFLINRLQHAILHEAFHLIEQGIATAEEIDEAAKWVLGPRMSVTGLIEQKDISGLDIAASSQRNIVPALHHGDTPSPVLQDMVKQGDLGLKTGRGFYDWSQRDAQAYVRKKQQTLTRVLHLLKQEEEQ